MPVNMLQFGPESSRSSSDDGQFSAREMLSLMRDHVWEIAGITLVVIALAVAYVFLATPIYSADVLVRVDSTEPNALGISR
jgi:tyrosine-protein kinase Etk/Wzc